MSENNDMEPTKPSDKDVLDANYPLMIRLRETCPGTYAHSKNVADLLESIGVELGLDGKRLRIAGFLHDIGYYGWAFPEP